MENEPRTYRAQRQTQATDPLISAWEKTLGRRASEAAIFDTRGAVARTFSEIDAEARGFERDHLRDLPPHSVVAIQLGNHSAWPALLLACLRRELVALPMEGSIAERERDVALDVCHAAAIGVIEHEQVVIRPRKSEPIAWGEFPPALLKLTSGTTAAPRAIRFRSAQLLADCAQICQTMGITERDRNFAVIPLSHSYGFSNVVTSLLALGVPAVVSRDRMPRAVLEDLARTGATVFPGMPVFYQAFCEIDSPPELPALRLCISAGAPLPLAVAQKFRAKFGHAIHSFYGSSECGGICYDREATLLRDGFVGTPMDKVTLRALEPAASASQFEVRSVAAGDGYFPEPDTDKLTAGRFVPDDLLAQEPDGFRIVGRVSDVINVAGKKVNPAEVEAVLLSFAGVRQAVVFGRDSAVRNEEVLACVAAESDLREADLLDFCRARLSGWQVPRQVFLVAEIPVNERGKMSRRALAQKFAEKKGRSFFC